MNTFLDLLISGTNVSHTIILEPKKSGSFNFTSAQVSYKASEDATDPQVGSFMLLYLSNLASPGSHFVTNPPYFRKFM